MELKCQQWNYTLYNVNNGTTLSTMERHCQQWNYSVSNSLNENFENAVHM